MTKNNIKCHSCGRVNKAGNKFCSNCGAELKTNNNSGQISEDKKSISRGRLYAFGAALLILAAVNLYVGGVFDSVGISASSSVSQKRNPQSDNPHTGADLSQLKKITELENILAANPDDHNTLLKLAHLYNDSGFKEKAIQKYKLYLKSHPDSPDVWVDMGVCYFDLKDYDNALRSMKKGVELNPKHQIAYFNMGIVNFAMNKIDQAKKNWKKAVDLNPESSLAEKAEKLINNN